MPFLADRILSFIPTNAIPPHLASYIPGESPFSTWPVVASMTVTYLAVVFGTREIMKDRAPLELTTPFRAHNLILSAGSLLLMALIGEEVFLNWTKVGTYGSLCVPEAYTNSLELYMMVNYYFKYYEFVDTVFLTLKKKPLSFLHVYHHSATAVLAFVQLNGRATATWIPAFLNLGIHVLMYYYYFATAGGAKLWWKKHLTTMQILQFIVILAVGLFVSYQYLAYNWFPTILPHMGNCTATPTAAIVGTGIIASYLILFLRFFRKTYTEKAGLSKNVATTGSSKITRDHIKGKPSVNTPGNLRFRVETTTR
ncbi:GNS1/SUR4 membrane protein [Paxillus ammoniavirescens]|nr:GNS1/SUR4 membrane protein [Paxillus ammoniavirescens]